MFRLREFRLDDVYSPTFARYGRFRMEKIATWNERHGLTYNETQTKFEKRRNFGGITLSSVITVRFIFIVSKYIYQPNVSPQCTNFFCTLNG